MKLAEAKAEFIQAWGTLGSSWGINRTMSQIHALLIVSPKPMSAEEIMDELKISRGNANMNIRALMDWNLVKKQLIPGERKEYFSAGKDIVEVARQIAKERKRREIDPILEVMESLKKVEGTDQETEDFKKVITELGDFTQKVESTLDKFIRSDKNWFYKTAIKLMS
ncbi:MAG: transcriptional regulator [Salibacteraceae bacterium]|nr:transcriptional regulator [Salibacteraceae bacterium]MDP4763249.1 transcriptional regulator [Salibacteraceae bacterium]MDP4843593.1 transcriptional regulator [Salibacteraceae bacterium]MDP4965418.1 transcriptional regulator [Salibacteraceae bacterium]